MSADEIDLLIAEAAEAAVEARAAKVHYRETLTKRTRLIWRIRQRSVEVSGRPWSAMKIARKLSQLLVSQGVQVDSGHGISHDNVRRVIEGPDPT